MREEVEDKDREEVEDKDRWLIGLLDKRKACTREWCMWEVDRRYQIMFRQMFLMVKDARRSPNESSKLRPDR